jgi:hypothetical protein
MDNQCHLHSSLPVTADYKTSNQQYIAAIKSAQMYVHMGLQSFFLLWKKIVNTKMA